MKQTILALLLISNGSIAFASFTDGNELHKWQLASENRSSPSFESGLFNGYVAGVADTGDGYLFCTTSGVTRGQLSAIVSKYLKNNPESWNKSADLLIIDALNNAFPCKK